MIRYGLNSHQITDKVCLSDMKKRIGQIQINYHPNHLLTIIMKYKNFNILYMYIIIKYKNNSNKKSPDILNLKPKAIIISSLILKDGS